MGVRWSRLSWNERNELWARWRRGQSLREIARALRRVSSSVNDIVGAEGGGAPRPRRRSRLALTISEREEISRQLARGRSVRAIGRDLRRAPSTIRREVARNHGARCIAPLSPIDALGRKATAPSNAG
jgi:IS30 family transposase